MAIYELLHEIKDQREPDGICSFNGYLEDYVTTIEETMPKETAFFQALLKKDEDLRICAGLKLNINKKSGNRKKRKIYTATGEKNVPAQGRRAAPVRSYPKGYQARLGGFLRI